ncbi:BLUF domain-containing protein [Brevundimonas sp. DWR2-3-1b1]|uniref:BLUF domain-containing protein n=1 Tax=unclassified Brevundimonas TaxID=2622653 RepID=UPI003CEF01AC
MIDRLVYRSHAVAILPEVALDRIFRSSLSKNARMNITGALGFSQQTYIQLLEGSPFAIDELVKTLVADTRHTQLRILLRGSSERRLLPDWSMARVDLAKAAPETATLIKADDGLGLIALMATLAHEGVAT